jgi:hypothetical protein
MAQACAHASARSKTLFWKLAAVEDHALSNEILDAV